MSVTLRELKNFLKLPASLNPDDEVLLDEVLQSAVDVVAEMVDASLESGERTFTVRPNGRHLVLPLTHLSVEQPVTVTDPHGHDVLAGDLDINHLSGIVTVRRAIPGTWTVRATPRQGNAPINLAIKIIAQHLWGVQRGTAGARDRAYAAGPDAPAPGVGFAIPRRAAQLLEPYRHL